MSNVTPFTLLAILCLVGPQQGQAQPVACNGNHACVADDAGVAIARTVNSRNPANPANLAGPERCPGGVVDVTASTPDERRLACAAANDTIQLLDRCGISLHRPLNVQIMSEVRHPFGGAIFGIFDPKQERVLITKESNIPSLVRDTPYAALPQSDFYRSLIVHEVVHGVMHQNLKGPVTSSAANEYMAYALQIESLAPDVRDRFLQSFDQSAIRADFVAFSDPILFFDPFFFAARVYLHFKVSANGCAHLTAVLEGRADFIVPPQM